MVRPGSPAAEDGLDRLALATDGAQLLARVLTQDDLDALTSSFAGMAATTAGLRIFGDDLVRRLCRPDGALGAAVGAFLPGARAVRAVLFDKSPANNWSVGWHQDRTIVVRRRIETDGYGPWSSKAGLLHVEPPIELLAGMVTLRAHIDDCGAGNAPLLVALASHRLGRAPAREAAAWAKRSARAACLARAGDAWIYATTIIHASEPALKPARRRVLQVDFSASGLPAELEWAGI